MGIASGIGNPSRSSCLNVWWSRSFFYIFLAKSVFEGGESVNETAFSEVSDIVFDEMPLGGVLSLIRNEFTIKHFRSQLSPVHGDADAKVSN